MTANRKQGWIGLRLSLVLVSVAFVGCMKPGSNSQTIIDPSSEQSYEPSEAYSPEVLKPRWRDVLHPEMPADVVTEPTPDRRQGTEATPKVSVETSTEPTPVEPSAEPTSPQPVAQPRSTQPQIETSQPGPVQSSNSVVAAPPLVATTGVAVPSGTTAVAPVTAPTQSVRREFRPIPRPSETVTAPTGRQTVTAPTGRQTVTVPTGRQTVTAPTGRQTVTAPTGRQTVTAPTGRTTVTAPKVTPKPAPRAEVRTELRVPAPAHSPRETYSIAPATAKDIVETGTITPTVYFLPVIDEDKESCDDKLKLYLTDGSVRMTVCRRTLSFCSEQGSCMVRKSGRWSTFNVIRRVNGIDRFKEIKDSCVYGYGVQNICLDPFYTVAADLSIYRPGDVIYLPKLRGEVLPNGQRHDGFVIVRDRGRGVKGRGRFDFFSGGQNWVKGVNPFVKLRLNDKNTDLEYHRVTGELAQRVKAKRGYPKLPSAGVIAVSMNSNTRGVPTSAIAQPGSDIHIGSGGHESAASE